MVRSGHIGAHVDAKKDAPAIKEIRSNYENLFSQKNKLDAMLEKKKAEEKKMLTCSTKAYMRSDGKKGLAKMQLQYSIPI